MKRTFLAFSILILTFLVWWQPINFGSVEVTIPDGANAREIAENLLHNRVVRDKQEFLLWLRITGRQKDLESGTYELQRYKNPVYVINKLSHGGKSDIVVTIPEGLTIYETADILSNNGVINHEEFLRLCNNEIFIQKLGFKGTSLEGYLFPDTYSFSASQTDSQIIVDLVGNFNKHIEDLNFTNPDSLHDIIILASLAEKEAKLGDERPIIAKVFINRLKIGRPLESCATVLYALKSINYDKYRTKIRLTEHDLKLNSPYNTYIHPGLPPGPICSPGENSIAAAIAPADVDYLYFVSKGNGQHHFSRTFRDHVAAKEKYNAAK